MRSSPSPRAGRLDPAAAIAVVLAAGAAACGNDTQPLDPQCEASFLRYDNFGAPFIINWCRACHSTELPPDMRQQAPDDVNFDTLADIRAWSTRIARAAGEGIAMPPAGGPSAAERDMLVAWLRCGAP